ncbi:hypothetical protein [Paenibacillus hexagrammi]|uniref:Tetratricopeptide repeat protein n=1 Tax=Paenibacillus hexagrammi TaxID=2908839 RepID=A0ABY3SSL0_9BACL|nr:hypothetical protein [Paenibacillus sp. YPD9-1]UJF35967.1 hypothetical protein L0M14_13305 [Paenibacillus sp. YPD9-1]
MSFIERAYGLKKMERYKLSEHVFQSLYARLLRPDEAFEQSETTASGARAEYEGERETILILQAAYYKKQGNYDRALTLWRESLLIKNNVFTVQLEPYLELAMYYEHREKNFEQALFYAEEARNKLMNRRSLERAGSRTSSKRAEEEKALDRRIQRLREKQHKARSKIVNMTSEGRTGSQEKKARNPRRTKPTYVCEGLI